VGLLEQAQPLYEFGFLAHIVNASASASQKIAIMIIIVFFIFSLFCY
jgi:hypothetical protein